MQMTRSQIVGALGIMCCVSAAWAQQGTPPGGIPGGPPGGFPGGPPGGFGPISMPKPGEVLPQFLQDRLKLSAEQKKKLGELQKNVDANLTKLLTAEQKKSLDEMSQGKGGFGRGFGGPGGAPGGTPPGGVPGGGMPKGGFGPPPGFGGGFGGSGSTSTKDVQKKIGATDEEWKVIGPKLQKVIAARRTLNGEGGAMAGPFGAGAASNIVGQAQADLKAVLDDPKHSKTDVEEKIAAVRKSRVTARANLEEAQRDLARLLTPAQQTIMVSLGHLD